MTQLFQETRNWREWPRPLDSQARAQALDLARTLFEDQNFTGQRVAADQMMAVSAQDKHLLTQIYFLNGQCHAFAMAVHQMTGWAIAGFDWRDYGDGSLPGHVFVLTPGGYGFDVTGLFTAGDSGEHAHISDNLHLFTDWQEIDLHDVQAYSDRSVYQSAFYWHANMQAANRTAERALRTCEQLLLTTH